MKGTEVAWLCIVVCILGMYVGLILGCIVAEKDERSKAITAGVAYYSCDPVSGKTTFVYGIKK